MHCTDWLRRGALAALGLAAGCSVPPAPPGMPAAVEAVDAVRRPDGAAAAAAAPLPLRLAPPQPVRNWGELRLQAALRLVAANPDGSYSGSVPEVLLAIPVLEIELNADGSVRRIEVLRPPREATDTVQLAIDAVRRAAPFGDVSRLPRPWKFVETFLFDDARRFKPRSLER